MSALFPCGGRNVDNRHYSSLLILIGLVAVAWVMSQFPTPPPTPDDLAVEPNLASVPASDVAENRGGRQPAPQPEIAAREVAAEEALPVIPGLLERVPLTPRAASPVPVSPTAAPLSDNGPLRAGAGGLAGREGSEAVARSEGAAAVPTFSLPNTLPILRHSPRDRTPTEPEGRAEANFVGGSSLGPALGLAAAGVPASEAGAGDPRPWEPAQEPLQPQLLPGNRHVLRPIIRGSAGAPPTGVSVLSGEAPLAAWEVSAPAPPADSAVVPRGGSALGTPPTIRQVEPEWGPPMPGVKAKTAPGPGIPTSAGLEPAPAFPGASSAPTAPYSLDSASDPLFVLAAQDLYRLPATAEPGRGASPGDPSRDIRYPVGLAAENSLSRGRYGSSPSGGVDPAPPHVRDNRQNQRPRRVAADYIWHVIQKNQSLESISFQYQGDESLVPRLRQLNGDILADPNLLPIGRAIRVPVR
jgi:hypothetical protein